MGNCNLVDKVIMNNFVDSIDEAIKDVGGDTSQVENVCDYPDIIREQLVAGYGTSDINLVEGDGINIEKNGVNYTFSSDSSGKLINSLTFKDIVINKDKSIQYALDTLFNNVLPIIPSVLSGDVIMSTDNGTDQYQHPNGDPEVIKLKKNLTPNTLYMRIFIVSQEEPIYIDLSKIGSTSGGGLTDAPSDGKLYGRKNGKWWSINESGKTTAPLSPPHPKDTDIPTGTPIQKVFQILFDTVLPAMPSVLKGDIITAGENGTDQYQHPNFCDKTATASGLVEGQQYIRLFVNSQQEPIYISCKPLNISTGGKEYTGENTETAEVNVNNETNKISVNVVSINSDMINESDKLSEEDAGQIFDEIFK